MAYTEQQRRPRRGNYTPRPKVCQFCADKEIKFDYTKYRFASPLHYGRWKNPSPSPNRNLRKTPT